MANTGQLSLSLQLAVLHLGIIVMGQTFDKRVYFCDRAEKLLHLSPLLISQIRVCGLQSSGQY